MTNLTADQRNKLLARLEALRMALSTAGKVGEPILMADGKRIDMTKAASDLQIVQALLRK